MTTTRTPLYVTVWRWHLYAGLVIMPIVLILAFTGGMYLFEREFEGWWYRDLLSVPHTSPGEIDHDRIVRLIHDLYPEARIMSYRPPDSPLATAEITFSLDKTKMRGYLDSTSRQLLGTVEEAWRPMTLAREIHKGLLLGTTGRVITELAACWLIVLLLSGVYLWWPRGNKRRGVFMPRLRSVGRQRWREVHAVSGAWAWMWILALLLTGLPWAIVWGGLLDNAAQKAGEGFPQAVFARRPESKSNRSLPEISMNQLVDAARTHGAREGFKIDFPWSDNGSYGVLPARHGHEARDAVYLFFDRRDGQLLERYGWSDMGNVGRLTSLGVAFHEGRLFGRSNQLLNLGAVVLLIVMTVSGAVMWWTRRPARGDLPSVRALAGAPVILWIVAVVGVALPLFGVSVVVLWALESVLLKRWRMREVSKSEPQKNLSL